MILPITFLVFGLIFLIHPIKNRTGLEIKIFGLFLSGLLFLYTTYTDVDFKPLYDWLLLNTNSNTVIAKAYLYLIIFIAIQPMIFLLFFLHKTSK